MVAIVLKCLQEALDSVVGPWDRAPLFFCFTSEDDCKKHKLIYIYIYLSGAENLCCYTLSPCGLNHREL
jgi:hypothetical protein